MGKINKDWHEQNKMPANPTERQRAEWHLAHAANCTCRALTPSIIALIAAQTGKVPVLPADRTEPDKPRR